MSHRGDVERFDRWAKTYDRHWMQMWIIDPIQRTVLELAAAESPSPATVLDVGCGTGRLLRAAGLRFPDATLFGVDPAAGMVEQARASNPVGSATRFEVASAENLPFDKDRFDLVFSTLTFHHWRDQEKGIAEIARVLAPGGSWLLADLVATGAMRYVRRLLRMRRFRERRELETMLDKAGLAVFAERQVPGLGGQVPALAIASPR